MKKVLSFVLALCLLVGCPPFSASAAGDFVIENGVLVKYLGNSKNIVIPTGVTEIGYQAFGMESGEINDYTRAPFLQSIESITIPNTCTKIGYAAFFNCKNLREINIPASVTSFGQNAFFGTAWIKNQGEFVVRNGILLGYNGSAAQVRVPSNVSRIANSAFSNDNLGIKNMTSLTIPSSVKVLDSNIFSTRSWETSYYFTNLKTITIESGGITEIGEHVFSGADYVEKMVIPATVTKITPTLFDGILTTVDGQTYLRWWSYSDGPWPEKFTIHGEAGSAAEEFANQWNIPFVASLSPYSGTPFYDISTHWGREAIKWAYQQGLFSGVSDTAFGPNQNMSRGMLATVLHRLAGKPNAENGVAFTDVSSNKYYAEAVAWASANKIVSGVGNGKYAPDADITREQIATILYNYARLSEPVTANGNLTQFTDGGKTSGYAQTAMRWAIGAGIIGGKGNGILDPQGKATRAEVASMLQRFAK